MFDSSKLSQSNERRRGCNCKAPADTGKSVFGLQHLARAFIRLTITKSVVSSQSPVTNSSERPRIGARVGVSFLSAADASFC